MGVHAPPETNVPRFRALAVILSRSCCVSTCSASWELTPPLFLPPNKASSSVRAAPRGYGVGPRLFRGGFRSGGECCDHVRHFAPGSGEARQPEALKERCLLLSHDGLQSPRGLYQLWNLQRTAN